MARGDAPVGEPPPQEEAARGRGDARVAGATKTRPEVAGTSATCWYGEPASAAWRTTGGRGGDGDGRGGAQEVEEADASNEWGGCCPGDVHGWRGRRAAIVIRDGVGCRRRRCCSSRWRRRRCISCSSNKWWYRPGSRERGCGGAHDA